jgi:hypothetical protein
MASPNPLTYNEFVRQVALLAAYQTQMADGVLQGVEAGFNAALPSILNYAEDRLQRDLELLALQTLSPAYSLVVGNPVLAVPTADFIVVQDMLVSGKPLNPVSRNYIQTMWPPASPPGAPSVFAILGGDLATAGVTSTLILVGPTPDQPYPATLVGQIRAPSLASYANALQADEMTTWISTWLPELLVLAAMIYVSGYQRDFGRQADDPQMAQSYESQYGTLLQSAKAEDYRRRLEADAWTARASSPIATPART